MYRQSALAHLLHEEPFKTFGKENALADLGRLQNLEKFPWKIPRRNQGSANTTIHGNLMQLGCSSNPPKFQNFSSCIAKLPAPLPVVAVLVVVVVVPITIATTVVVITVMVMAKASHLWNYRRSIYSSCIRFI